MSGNPATLPAVWDTICAVLTDASGCSATDCIVFGEHIPKVCAAGISKYSLPGDSVRLGVVINDDINNVLAFQWSNGATSNSIDINAPGIYCVTVTFATGCTATKCQDVVLEPALKVIVEFSGSGNTANNFGDIYLIHYDTASGGILTAIDPIPFVNGIGNFSGLTKGNFPVTLIADQEPGFPGDSLVVLTLYNCGSNHPIISTIPFIKHAAPKEVTVYISTVIDPPAPLKCIWKLINILAPISTMPPHKNCWPRLSNRLYLALLASSVCGLMAVISWLGLTSDIRNNLMVRKILCCLFFILITQTKLQ